MNEKPELNIADVINSLQLPEQLKEILVSESSPDICSVGESGGKIAIRFDSGTVCFEILNVLFPGASCIVKDNSRLTVVLELLGNNSYGLMGIMASDSSVVLFGNSVGTGNGDMVYIGTDISNGGPTFSGNFNVPGFVGSPNCTFNISSPETGAIGYSADVDRSVNDASPILSLLGLSLNQLPAHTGYHISIGKTDGSELVWRVQLDLISHQRRPQEMVGTYAYEILQNGEGIYLRRDENDDWHLLADLMPAGASEPVAPLPAPAPAPTPAASLPERIPVEAPVIGGHPELTPPAEPPEAGGEHTSEPMMYSTPEPVGTWDQGTTFDQYLETLSIDSELLRVFREALNGIVELQFEGQDSAPQFLNGPVGYDTSNRLSLLGLHASAQVEIALDSSVVDFSQALTCNHLDVDYLSGPVISEVTLLLENRSSTIKINDKNYFLQGIRIKVRTDGSREVLALTKVKQVDFNFAETYLCTVSGEENTLEPEFPVVQESLVGQQAIRHLGDLFSKTDKIMLATSDIEGCRAAMEVAIGDDIGSLSVVSDLRLNPNGITFFRSSSQIVLDYLSGIRIGDTWVDQITIQLDEKGDVSRLIISLVGGREMVAEKNEAGKFVGLSNNIAQTEPVSAEQRVLSVDSLTEALRTLDWPGNTRVVSRLNKSELMESVAAILHGSITATDSWSIGTTREPGEYSRDYYYRLIIEPQGLSYNGSVIREILISMNDDKNLAAIKITTEDRQDYEVEVNHDS